MAIGRRGRGVLGDADPRAARNARKQREVRRRVRRGPPGRHRRAEARATLAAVAREEMDGAGAHCGLEYSAAGARRREAQARRGRGSLMAVAEKIRRGKRVLTIDVRYRRPDGTLARYRRDSKAPTKAAAREEE